MSDSELMAGLLVEAGFNVTFEFPSQEDPCLVIINSCTVKKLSERKFFKELYYWKKKGVKILVAGCIPQADRDMLKKALEGYSVIGIKQITRVVEFARKTIDGKIISDISRREMQRLKHPLIRKRRIIEILPISEGCLGGCSYCKTKHARGSLVSYEREDIITQFKNALAQGCKEFWITSQDNGCYGFDKYATEEYFLPELLKDLLVIEGNFMVRLGMINPNHMKKIYVRLIEIFKHPKMFKFLHVPVQSGNDRILRLMKREYTTDEFLSIINLFKKEIPHITISTDIIVGFPEETEDEFNDSIRLIEKLRPDVLNISRFWLRNNTEAEKLVQIRGGVSKKRSELVTKIFEDISAVNNKSWVGWTGNVLIDEYGKNNTIIARNEYYKQIIIPRSCNSNKFYVQEMLFNKRKICQDNSAYLNDLDIGNYVRVKIVSSSVYHLEAELLTEINPCL